MPTISMFYGILIKMFFKDVDKHKEDLIADWTLAKNGKTLFKIKGLDQ